MRVNGIPMVIIATLLPIAAPAMAGERPGCHVYDARDSTPELSGLRAFRFGYEVVEVCRTIGGGSSYVTGFRPRKGRFGVCTYDARSVDRVERDGRIRWEVGSEHIDPVPEQPVYHMASMPDDDCPPFGDKSYVDSGGVPEEVLAAILMFWNDLNVGTVDRAFAGVRDPNGAKRKMIVDYKQRGGPSGFHLARIIDVSSAGGGGKQRDAADPPYGFAMWTTNYDQGWLVGGDMVDGRFVPSTALPWIE